MTANRKGVKVNYAMKIFEEARQKGDTERKKFNVATLRELKVKVV